MTGSEPGKKWVNFEVLEGVPTFVELGRLGFAGGFDRRDGIGGLGFESVGRSGEHLDDLLEGGSVSLDEGGWVRVGFGSGDG